jgi:taurine dioxygenase
MKPAGNCVQRLCFQSPGLTQSQRVSQVRLNFRRPQRRGFATTTDLPFRLTRLSGAVGAAIHDVDLTSLNETTVSLLRKAFLDHGVIFFRPKDPAPLSPEQFRTLCSLFGKPIRYPFVSGISEDHPEIIRVLKKEHETNNFGGIWHTDTAYLEVPPMGTLLMAEEVPSYGGDTIFANQYLAYESLSEGMKKVLNGLKGVNSSAKADVSKTREDRVKDSTPAKGQPESYESIHPVVRTHPETGRKSLYVNTAHTARFDGWTEKESEGLLKFLHEHQVKVEFTGRWQWRNGDIAFWDNRCMLHNPVNDYQGYRRGMLRITLEGDRPV